MSGSYLHVATADGQFTGCGLLDHLGDAYESLEECVFVIRHLSGGDSAIIKAAVDAYYESVNPDYKPGAIARWLTLSGRAVACPDCGKPVAVTEDDEEDGVAICGHCESSFAVTKQQQEDPDV